MSLTQLSAAELQDLLMEETKRLTSAIRDNSPISEREEMRKHIQEIQRLLEEKKDDSFSSSGKNSN